MRIILITGISGSGKTVALNALEDAGYYCVDNLPPRFLLELTEFLARDGYTRLAVAIDARAGSAVANLPEIVNVLQGRHEVQVLFLNASTQALIQRFSETRRRHPLSLSANGQAPNGQASLADAIESERELVADLTSFGHQIDTSNLRAHNLRAWVRQFAAHDHVGMALMFESFGFKRGVPLDADFVFDARALPNPHYDEQLRPLTGLDKPVADFLHVQPEVKRFIDDIARFLQTWIPRFRADHRSYLTIAIGCTGGWHRSVYIAAVLGQRFANEADVLVRHREIDVLEEG